LPHELSGEKPFKSNLKTLFLVQFGRKCINQRCLLIFDESRTSGFYKSRKNVFLCPIGDLPVQPNLRDQLQQQTSCEGCEQVAVLYGDCKTEIFIDIYQHMDTDKEDTLPLR
jgi:hypothetical protein